MVSELYKKILIATDGKEFTKNAVHYGIKLTKSAGATLYALYVIDTAEFASIPMDASWETVYAELKQKGEEATSYIADRAQSEGLNVRRDIVEGHPAEEIIKYAEKKSVGLIVMGTAQKKWLDRFLLGSVTEKVIRNSKVPVLVAPVNKQASKF